MGCVVNGPEKQSRYWESYGKESAVIFKKGEIL